MASEFERILQKLGGIEAYLGLAKKPMGRFLVTVEIQPLYITYIAEEALTRGEGKHAIDVLHHDRKYTTLLIEAAESGSFEQARRYINDALGVLDRTDESTRVSEGREEATEAVQEVTADLVQEATNNITQEETSLNASLERLNLSGTPVDGLYEHLSSCNAISRGTDKYYGKYCLAVQSSGTGKTYTILKFLRKKVLGLYMNIRPRGLTNALPRRDDIPANILDVYPKSEEEYGDICTAFFTAVFTALRKNLELNGMTDKSDEGRFIAWSNVMNDLRSPSRRQFFQNLAKEHDSALKAIGSGDAWRDWPFPGAHALKAAYRDLVESFPSFFDPSTDNPKLVIAIDSARELGGEPVKGYRRSQVLCRTIAMVSKHDRLSNWVVIVASGTSVKDFLTPTKVESRMPTMNKLLFPPYSQFGWDRRAKPLPEIEPGKVADFSNIVGFGRPLWKTLFDEGHGEYVIMATACEKLCLGAEFSMSNDSQILAVWGQRFCLDFRFGHPGATEYQIKAISSHLRVCLDTTQDGLWHTTLSPSEPILSCAASEILHAPKYLQLQDTRLTSALESLYCIMKTGLVEVANNGEPVSLITYLVAKDLCVRTPGSKLWRDPVYSRYDELGDCRPLQVVDYLKFLFGETALDQDMKETFSDWYIDFSHWICMGQPIKSPGLDGWSGMHTWLARLWTRTGAVQCCSGQRAISMLIPMYKLGHRPEPESGNARDAYTGRVSYILISDRAGVDVSRITPRDADIPELGQPYIAIHADLRAKDKKARFDLTEDGSSTRCLRIYAPGVNAETYSFLGPETNSSTYRTSALQNILRLSEEKLPSSVSFLKAQVQYGHSVGSEHTGWEIGRRK